MFVDRVTIHCRAGSGGNGVVAWRREKYIPKGGPTGGNGGRGGSITLQADPNVFALEAFKRRRLVNAANGGAGGGSHKQGKNGASLILSVPVGTEVRDAETGALLCDLAQKGQSFLICQGGRGGRGNFSFRSPTNRAPNIATPGTPGEEHVVVLELKLIADVGLIGYPNAGKSTLLSVLASVPVKIAPYPFTTLQPNLGFVRYRDGSAFLLADIPGIIEGAHANRGLGFAFLRHIERTKMLVYVLDAAGSEGRDPVSDYAILRRELGAYNPELLGRPSLVVLNKCDLPEAEGLIRDFMATHGAIEGTIYVVSGERREGLEALKAALKACIVCL